MARSRRAKTKRDKSVQTPFELETGEASSSIYIPIGKTLLGITIVMTIVSAIFGLYVYLFISLDAELPPLHLDQWWGSIPKNHNSSIIRTRISFKDESIKRLRDSLLNRPKLVPSLEGVGFRYGFNTEHLDKVLNFWLYGFDIDECQKHINSHNNYYTYIQGLRMHYIRIMPNTTKVKSYPLLMLHGWPSTVRQFFMMTYPLTNEHPAYDFVFELIIPSLPGFAFSEGPTRPGFGPLEAAIVLRNLMHRIGHKKFYVHGGGLGHVIGSAMATAFPEEVLGFHTNTPYTLHPLAMVYTLIGSLWPSWMTSWPEYSLMYPLSEHLPRMLEETGYLHLQATKPDTIGIALTDSPIGLAAYILEKFSSWRNYYNRQTANGGLDQYSLNDLLDHVTIYWVTDSITTSMRMYAELFSRRTLNMNLEMIPTPVPTAGARFTADFTYQPGWLLRLKYPKFMHHSLRFGGHFASLDLPMGLSVDIFEAVDTFNDPFNLKQRGFKPMQERAQKLATIQSHSPKQDLETQGNPETATTVYDFIVRNIQGEDVKLDKYKGHVLLIVNVASQCGLTDQNYQQLNELHDRYADRGLRILAFPCNQFYGQEPGTPSEILNFVRERGVKFDVFEKVDVNGDNTHPLWKFLKRAQGGTFGDFIKWNFSKFIVDKTGVPVERFGPNVDPKDLEPHIVKYL